MAFAPADFIFGAVAVFERHPFVIGTCYIDQGVSLQLFFYIIFIFYKTLPDLKELRHLINDIKLDTVLTINKPLT